MTTDVMPHCHFFEAFQHLRLSKEDHTALEIMSESGSTTTTITPALNGDDHDSIKLK